MKINKKFFLLLLGAGALSQAAVAAEGHASSYTFLSAGLAVDNNGLASDYQALVKKRELSDKTTDLKAEDLYSLKTNSIGGYLNGSYGFENNIFLEAQLRYLPSRQQGFFAGVGYYFPMDERSSFYVLAGASKPDLPEVGKLTQKGRDFLLPMVHIPNKPVKFRFGTGSVTVDVGNYVGGSLNLEADEVWMLLGDNARKIDAVIDNLRNDVAKQAAASLDKVVVNFKSNIAPAIEVGYRINFNDNMGVRLAYRSSYDNIEIEHFATSGKCFSEKDKGLSNERSVRAHYHFTPELAVEGGYTFTKLT